MYLNIIESEIGFAFQDNLGMFACVYGEKVSRSAAYLLDMNVYTHFENGPLFGGEAGDFINMSPRLCNGQTVLNIGVMKILP